VWAALRQVSPLFAEAVVLVDLQDRPYAEAAAIVGVPVNTLRTRLHRGRLRLAELLRPEAAAGQEPCRPQPAMKTP
jgi:RNA polymerase sigma-70 factor, ECF subfamily